MNNQRYGLESLILLLHRGQSMGEVRLRGAVERTSVTAVG